MQQDHSTEAPKTTLARPPEITALPDSNVPGKSVAIGPLESSQRTLKNFCAEAQSLAPKSQDKEPEQFHTGIDQTENVANDKEYEQATKEIDNVIGHSADEYSDDDSMQEASDHVHTEPFRSSVKTKSKSKINTSTARFSSRVNKGRPSDKFSDTHHSSLLNQFLKHAVSLVTDAGSASPPPSQ
ncbi:hypothetical protein G6F56_003396 [Rhizopus delemar]|nr:hypothetical protein G6F56_003396 [Rhizopus delemar]